MLNQHQSKFVSERFREMEGESDLLALLNYVKVLCYGKNAIPISWGEVTSYIQADSNNYRRFLVKKKSGGERVIHSPKPGLKVIQRVLNVILACIFEPHQAATGFIVGKSVVDNAKCHIRRNYVYNIDIKDFFPSASQCAVWRSLEYEPFNLGSSKGRRRIGQVILSLCLSEVRIPKTDADGYGYDYVVNRLPQGTPTSPIITNIVCRPLDIRLTDLAERFGVVYTRYADDMTFSSQYHSFGRGSGFLKGLHTIVLSEGFTLNDRKTRLQKQGYRQEVTGLITNEKVNIRKRYVKQLRMWLYLWERFGYEKAQRCFLKDYAKEYRTGRSNSPNIEYVIGGKLNYLCMVKGRGDSVYRKLFGRFKVLLNALNKPF